jgi:hypothetical protein
LAPVLYLPDKTGGGSSPQASKVAGASEGCNWAKAGAPHSKMAPHNMGHVRPGR